MNRKRYDQLFSVGITVILFGMNDSLGNANSKYNSAGPNYYRLDSIPKQPVGMIKDANNLLAGETIAGKTSENLFVKAVLSKRHSYTGEPILLRYILYARLEATTSIHAEPLLHGFSTTDLNPGEIRKSITRINGREYELFELKKLKLIPLMEGNLQIDPIVLDYKIRYAKNVQPSQGNQLSDLLGNLLQQENAESIVHQGTISSNPIIIKVQSLPEQDVRSGFNNAVGRFTLKASAPSEGKTHELMKLRLKISGVGDLSFIDPPTIQWPKNLVLQEVEQGEFKNDRTDDFETSKVFIYHFMAVNPGTVTIPPVSFIYFNPNAHAYASAQTIPIKIVVIKSASSAKAEPEPEKTNLSTVSVESALKKTSGQGNQKQYWLFATGTAMLVGLTLISRKMFTRKRNNTTVEKAKPSANDQLSQHIATGNHEGFYLQLNQILWTRITETFKLSPSECTKQNIDHQLQLRNWTMQDRCILRQLLCECDWNLYAPVDENQSDLQPILREATEILDKLS